METKDLLEFGPFRADLARRSLSRGGQPISLPGKAFDVLQVLLQRHGEIVTKDELMKAVWPGTFVEEGNLTQTIFVLRKALGDAEGQSLIVTIPRQGYRFTGAVAGPASIKASPQSIPAPPPRWRGMLPWILAAVMALSASIAFWFVRRAQQREPEPLLRLSVDLGNQAVEDANSMLAISPDGNRIVFPIRDSDGKQHLASRLLSSGLVTPLNGTEGAINPFFSPDGQSLGFFDYANLKTIPILGGTPVSLCRSADARGGAWGSDGSIVAALNSISALSRIPPGGGTPLPLTNLQDRKDSTHRWPQIIPGTDAVLFTANRISTNYDDATIDVVRWKSGQRKTIITGGYYGRYLSSGHLVWIRRGTLFGARFDPVRMELNGPPVAITEDVSGNSNAGNGQFDCSRNGTFVYLPGASQQWPVVWLDREGKQQPIISKPEHYRDPALSPDGKRLAIAVGLGNAKVWIYDFQRETFSQLTFVDEPSRYPVWTADSKHIVFSSIAPRGGTIWWIPADGSGEAEPIWHGEDNLYPFSLTPSNRNLLFSVKTRDPKGTPNWILPLDTSDPRHPKAGKPIPFLDQTSAIFTAAFSPDGRWVAYSAGGFSKHEIYVSPAVPGLSGKWQIPFSQGVEPVWSQQGHQILYQNKGQVMVADYAVQGDSFSAGKPQPWANTLLTGATNGRIFDIHPDGKRIVAFPAPEIGRNASNLHATFLVNFFEELKRRLP